MNCDHYRKFAGAIRIQTLHLVHKANASHVGGCFSMADILAVLYNGILKVDPQNPAWEQRDRFIISKAHAAAIIYAVLAQSGFFPMHWLDTYCQNGSKLGGHVTKHDVPGVEFSSGSLGHGLPVGCGMALAAQRDHQERRVFVMLSDGECDEGSVWEAMMFAGHFRLDNLIVILDYNKIQSFGTVKEVMDLEPLADKWRAFGWSVREIDGHDFPEIHQALSQVPFESGKPSVIIAHTVKGKGVSFMEGKLAWHYKSPNKEQLGQALAEIAAQSGVKP